MTAGTASQRSSWSRSVNNMLRYNRWFLLFLWGCCRVEFGMSSSSSSSSEPISTTAQEEDGGGVVDESSLRSLVVVTGSLPANYVVQVARFGNALDGSDGHDLPRTYNLMIPPENSRLCEYPAIYANVSAADQQSIREKVEEMYPTPVALMVNIDSCSPEQKTKVALKIRETMMSRLELLILYSPRRVNNNNNNNGNPFISLEPDHPSDNDNDMSVYNSIGVVHLPFRYAAGIQMRMGLAYNGADPRLLLNDNYNWNFWVQLTNFSQQGSGGDDDDYDDDLDRPPIFDGRGGGGQGNSGGGGGGDIYWFRIVLFSLLVLSPCCRACYLWYAGGGRVYFRRNEAGRIIGLQYIPPSAAWLTAGRLGGGNHGANAESPRTGTLTEEQFRTLPEIEYQKPLQSHYDEDYCEQQPQQQPVGSNAVVADERKECEATPPQADVELGYQTTAASTSNPPNHGNNIVSQRNEKNNVDDNHDETEQLENDEQYASPPNNNETTTTIITTTADLAITDQDPENVVASAPTEADSEATHQPCLSSDSAVQSSANRDNENGDDNDDDGAVFHMEQGEYKSSWESSTSVADQDDATPKPLSSSLVVEEDEEICVDKSTGVGDDDDNNNDNDVVVAEATERTRDTTDGKQEEEITTTNDVDVAVENDPLACKSSMCSICIDDFEEGEKIILLPRCQHGFHRDCIHPWLTERQGCCPFCKTPVFAEATEEGDSELPSSEEEENRLDTTTTAAAATPGDAEDNDDTRASRTTQSTEVASSNRTDGTLFVDEPDHDPEHSSRILPVVRDQDQEQPRFYYSPSTAQ